jgi:hypothetical protein
MPRVGTGSVIPKILTDGTCAYELRFHARGRRESVTLHERRTVPVRVWRRLGRAVCTSRARQHRCGSPRGGLDPRRAAPASGGGGRRGGAAHSDLSRVRVLLAADEDRRRARGQADRGEHQTRLPLAPARASAAVLRAPPARRDRPGALLGLQGPQGSRGRRPADRDHRRSGPPRSSREANRPASTTAATSAVSLRAGGASDDSSPTPSRARCASTRARSLAARRSVVRLAR